MANNLLVPNIGLGQELREHIERVLNIPPNAVAFSLHFRVGEVVRVDCEFFPVAREHEEPAA